MAGSTGLGERTEVNNLETYHDVMTCGSAMICNGQPGDPLRGLSVAFWSSKLLALLGATKNPDWKVYDVEPTIRKVTETSICPRDSRLGAALVDVAQDPFAGRSNLMLSYGWGYKIVDIVSALAAHCEASVSDPQDAIVWVCCICINQHRVKERQANGETVSFEEFQAAFGHRVQTIGNVLALLAPWHSPLYTSRAWCVYELYMASITEHVEVELILPPREHAAFKETFSDKGLHTIWYALSNMRVEKCQASVEEDRCRIFALIKQGPGFIALDKQVSQRIQAWFLKLAMEPMEEMLTDTSVGQERGSEVARVCSQLVDFNNFLGNYAAAQEIGRRTLAFCRQVDLRPSMGEALCRVQLGIAFLEHGAYANADAYLDQAMELFKSIGARKTEEAARCLKWQARSAVRQKDAARARGHFDQALETYGFAGAERSSEAAGCLRSLGALCQSQGKFDVAQKHFQLALEILQENGEESTLRTANYFQSIGMLSDDIGDHKQALVHYHHALDIFESLGTAGAANAEAIKEKISGIQDNERAIGAIIERS